MWKRLRKRLFFASSQAHVQALEGLLVEDQVLLLAGCPLENDASLASCGVSEHCTLEVAGRLLGGQYTDATHNSAYVCPPKMQFISWPAQVEK